MMMVGRLRRLGRGTAFVGGIAAGLLAACGAIAAPITWEKKGAFEACLESSLDAWVKAQAELVVNEEPAAGNIDDRAVAAWSITALAQCKAAAGAEVPASAERFTKHMAQWRQHIYDLATSIRQRGGAD